MSTTQELSQQTVNELVWQLAKNAFDRGPGFSQEGVVMREIAQELGIRGQENSQLQQQVLDAWHDLFASKRLGWGFNLDNPNSPFFHVRIP